MCVPVSRLAECIRETQADIETLGLPAPIVGHVGDGNFHVAVLVDPDDPDEVERAEAFHERLVRRAIAMDGHLHGRARRRLRQGGVPRSRSTAPEAVAMMRAIKRALDPADLFNPGKIADAAARPAPPRPPEPPARRHGATTTAWPSAADQPRLAADASADASTLNPAR